MAPLRHGCRSVDLIPSLHRLVLNAPSSSNCRLPGRRFLGVRRCGRWMRTTLMLHHRPPVVHPVSLPLMFRLEVESRCITADGSGSSLASPSPGSKHVAPLYILQPPGTYLFVFWMARVSSSSNVWSYTCLGLQDGRRCITATGRPSLSCMALVL